MRITEERVRERSTEAVYDRGRTYRAEGRVRRIDRFDGAVTAMVHGTRWYDVTVELAGETPEAKCSCPYRGPGDCKHVVAVLLELVADPPVDARGRVERVLDDAPPGELRTFVTDELARDPALRARFLARFGEPTDRSVEEYRAEVDRLFDEHTGDQPVVVEAIDFSSVTAIAEEYHRNGQYREAATAWWALAVGIEANMSLVDAAYDHYVETLQRALDRYVACVESADLSEPEHRTNSDVLTTRASEAVDYLAERYSMAAAELRSHGESGQRGE